MRKTVASFVMTFTILSGAHAQGIRQTTVVQPLTGWKCMALASSYGPNGAFAPAVPVFDGPEQSATKIGTSAGTILVAKDMPVSRGRTEILRPNGQKAWIDVRELTNWHSVSDRSATCNPAVLSNGRFGFTTTP